MAESPHSIQCEDRNSDSVPVQSTRRKGRKWGKAHSKTCDDSDMATPVSTPSASANLRHRLLGKLSGSRAHRDEDGSTLQDGLSSPGAGELDPTVAPYADPARVSGALARARDRAQNPPSYDASGGTAAVAAGGARGAGSGLMSAKALVAEVTNTRSALRLQATHGSFAMRASALPYNAICIELRDLFRILEGLAARAGEGTLAMDDLMVFYEWFEGFYGVLTCIFEVEEDVLFSWLEKIGAIKMENALAPKRRKTKQERAKDVCWDILELKMQFQKKADRVVSFTELVHEMTDECDHLASRLLTYLSTLHAELPPLIEKHFGEDEQALMQMAILSNLRASAQGKFVISAYARGVIGEADRKAFLNQAFKTPKKRGSSGGLSAGLRVYRKFYVKHVGVVNKLAITVSQLGERLPVFDDSGSDNAEGEEDVDGEVE